MTFKPITLTIKDAQGGIKTVGWARDGLVVANPRGYWSIYLETGQALLMHRRLSGKALIKSVTYTRDEMMDVANRLINLDVDWRTANDLNNHEARRVFMAVLHVFETHVNQLRRDKTVSRLSYIDRERPTMADYEVACHTFLSLTANGWPSPEDEAEYSMVLLAEETMHDYEYFERRAAADKVKRLLNG